MADPFDLAGAEVVGQRMASVAWLSPLGPSVLPRCAKIDGETLRYCQPMTAVGRVQAEAP